MTKLSKKICLWLFAAMLLLSVSLLALTKLPVKAENGEFLMETGASVRLDEPSGLRFTTKVDKSFIDGLEESNADKEITFGTEIKPECKDVAPVDIKQTVWAAESTETTKYFKAVLTNIPETQYLTELTATAYYAVDGVKTYVSNPQTRSVAYVASAALAAGKEDAAYLAIVDKAVAGISLGEDFALNVGDEKALAVTGGENLVAKFFSDNDAVAAVDENGVVRAVGAGTANISATLGSRTDSVAVTVNAVKKLFYSFEEEKVGSIYDKTLFASSNGTWDYLMVHNVPSGCTDGKQCLYRNAEGSGYPAIIIKNTVLQDFYNAYGGISFDIYNNGANLHNGYFAYNLGAGDQYYRVNLEAKTGATITVTDGMLKALVDSGKDLKFDIMNDGATHEPDLEYYLDNVRGAEKHVTVEKGGTLSAAELLGKNATRKSFTVYKDGVSVSEEGANSYTFTENDNYTFECVQAIEGYEDSTVKGSVILLDGVFNNVEKYVGKDKLIQEIVGYEAPVVTEYKGSAMIRMNSTGAWPRFELNKAMVESFLSEGKTFTLLFRLANIDGVHKTYVGNGVAHISTISGEEFAEISITPEKWEGIKNEADFAASIPVVTLAHYEHGTGGAGSDPFTMYLAGYKLS